MIPWVRLMVYAVAVLLVVGVLKGCHDSIVNKGVRQEQGAQAGRDRDLLKANERESMRRLAAQEVTDHESERQRQAARAAGVRAERLRNDRDTAIAQRRAADSAPEGQCTAARASADLYADLYRGADDRAGELAAYADGARIAGQQCERDYDALRSSP